MKLVGLEKVDYTKKDGTHIQGAKLHVLYEVDDEGYDNIDNMTAGQPVEAIYCNSGVSVPPLKIGDNIEVRFNRFNKPIRVKVLPS